ncbi:MAG: SusD/RagB family nutrient-binding outer membrane lipoprotein [Bacteroidales bacterium]|nr:SusD/RagB family nutrient-binding outer membrane lipoprotein [Bacteroidales bacterium]
MKNIKFLIILILGGVLLTAGCKKFLDVNHDPNNPGESRMDLVFPAGAEGVASILGNSFTSLGGIWSQHWTSDINQPGFMGEDSYNVQAGDYSYDLRGWNSLYYGPLMDLEWVKLQAEEQESWNYYLMATVLQCYSYQIMADLWNQIPLSDALQNHPAKFDIGEQVYDTLIARLDSALSKDFSESEVPDKDDLVFKGAMNYWKDFANTLKLKIYIRQRFARPTVALNGISELYNNNTSFLSVDAAFSDFIDESGRGNYWYESNLRSSDGALRASNTFLKYLQTNNDPRLDYIFIAPAEGHLGIWQGDFRDSYDSYGGQDVNFSLPNKTPFDPVYFISYTESLFLQAEAKMILNAPATEIEELYKQAVDENCNRYNSFSSVPIDPELIYGAGKYGRFPVSGTKTEQFNVLMMQKWIAMANGQDLEAFFDHNRTHIPKESPISIQDPDWDENEYVLNHLGEFTVSAQGVLPPDNSFPKRLLFSSTERSKNSNTPPSKPIYTPVWWEVSNPSAE